MNNQVVTTRSEVFVLPGSGADADAARTSSNNVHQIIDENANANATPAVNTSSGTKANGKASNCNKRKRNNNDDHDVNNLKDMRLSLMSLQDLESLLENAIISPQPILAPPDDPSFSRQDDYLQAFIRSIADKTPVLTWENLSHAMSDFLSYYMIRKVYGEDAEGLRSAARAMHNLILDFGSTPQKNGFIMSENNESDSAFHCGTTTTDEMKKNDLLKYTNQLAQYPYEVDTELQRLWDTCYWEKKEQAYPHLRASGFTLEPGDTYVVVDDKVNDENENAYEKEHEVVLQESDMIMTKADINNKLGGRVSIFLAIARVMGILFRDRGYGRSTQTYRVRGQEVTIYTCPDAKQEAGYILEDFRVNERQYEKLLVDKEGGRVKIKKVCKDGWWMMAEGTYCFGDSVFVPLTAKVAKMGVAGTVFSGMRLGLAGGVWRPLPSGEQTPPSICYNVYPPDLHSFTRG